MNSVKQIFSAIGDEMLYQCEKCGAISDEVHLLQEENKLKFVCRECKATRQNEVREMDVKLRIENVEIVYNGFPNELCRYLTAMLDELRKTFPFKLHETTD